ncbi:LOW QUALITY PROTEIN: uncharacterized protein LOC143143710 [Ptiloglossa arizonensis]|uniref:LOW QUALITY PROTEIN: uncharacterized protein LOC143143710 n=1 Tax=Ptiloglossa arizonensis TaxID=3350558 RepID=UPI003F9F6735
MVDAFLLFHDIKLLIKNSSPTIKKNQTAEKKQGHSYWSIFLNSRNDSHSIIEGVFSGQNKPNSLKELSEFTLHDFFRTAWLISNSSISLELLDLSERLDRFNQTEFYLAGGGGCNAFLANVKLQRKGVSGLNLYTTNNSSTKISSSFADLQYTPGLSCYKFFKGLSIIVIYCSIFIITTNKMVLSAKDNRMSKLQEWKTERYKRRTIENAEEKPPFIVGLVHHKFYSPIKINKTLVPQKKSDNRIVPTVSTSPIKRITRATEKRLMAKSSRIIDKKSIGYCITEYRFVKLLVCALIFMPYTPGHWKISKGSYIYRSEQVRELAQAWVAPPQPTTISEIVSNFSRKTRASIKNNTTKFIEVEIDDKECEEGSSIETIRLNVSSDEKEMSNSFNNSIVNSNNDDVNDHEKEKLNNKPSNNSIAQVSKILNNSTKEADTIFNNNVKTASFSHTDTPTSVQFNSPSDPVYFSPYIVSSRGKSNARKEQQLKRGFSFGSIRSADIPIKDTMMQNLNISVEEEERTAQYFQFLLNKEISRLKELCRKWEKVKTESKITEDAQYHINQAVGQTNLLISRKFERFLGLVSDCATGKGEMLVTCKDLKGFWDMMYMEVKNCDSRFEKIEQLRSQNWEEEQLPVVTKPLRKNTAAKKKILPKKSSSIRKFLTERKMKMTQEIRNKFSAEELEIISNKILTDKAEHHERSPNVKYRTRSTSVGPNDKKFSSIKREETRLTLLKKVQLSETKKLSTPLTVIKISQMCKTPDMCKRLSYFNSSQTPGKSILKQPKDSMKVESHEKITHTVNFDDTLVLNEVPVDEETQIKMDLAAALSRIYNHTFDCSDDNIDIHAERKLNFVDNSFDESENVFDVNKHSEANNLKNRNTNKIPSLQIQFATPLRESVSNSNSNTLLRRRILRRQSNVHENDEVPDESFNNTVFLPLKEITDDTDTYQKQISINDKEEIVDKDESIRVLRNRSIISVNTPKHKKTPRKISINVKESKHKENKTPPRTRKKSSLKVTIKNDEKINSKMWEESNCIENKPVLPMTPHATRSKLHLIEKQRRSTITKGSISEETPEKVPERVRRSHNRKSLMLIKSIGFI